MGSTRSHAPDPDAPRWPLCGTFQGYVGRDGEPVTCRHCLKRLNGEPLGPNAAEIARLRAALEHIDQTGCMRTVGPRRCWEDGRTRDAEYAADAWCDACIARDALNPVAPEA